MKSPDEFHYDFEPKRERRNPNEHRVIGTCPICGGCVTNDDYVVTFEDTFGEQRYAHESCSQETLTLTELLEKLDIEFDSGRGKNFEED